MDKNLLTNIYKLMILMRNDIKNSDNSAMCSVIIGAFIFRWKNDVMLSELGQEVDLDKYSNFFELGKSQCVSVKKRQRNMLIVCTEKLLESLHAGKYEFAYELVDALHVLSEVLADGKNINLYRYWYDYFYSMTDKYADDMADLSNALKDRVFNRFLFDFYLKLRGKNNDKNTA